MDKFETRAPDGGAPIPMDTVLERLTAEQREKALRIAHKFGIAEGDVTWEIVLLVLEAQDAKARAGQAAQAAGEAADRIRGEIRELPGGIKTAVVDGLDEAADNFVRVSNAVVAKAGAEIQKVAGDEKKAIADALNQATGKAVEEAIGKIANNTYDLARKRVTVKWLLIGGITASIIVTGLVGGIGWYAWSRGEAVGYATKASANREIRDGLYHVAKCDLDPKWKIIKRPDGEEDCDYLGGTTTWRVK